jgi:prolycopene isomerase
MPFNRTGISGHNAVAFSGFACAHRIGVDLGLNPWAPPA